jgi:hypothetical protein
MRLPVPPRGPARTCVLGFAASRRFQPALCRAELREAFSAAGGFAIVSRRILRIGWGALEKLVIFGFLVLATTVEASGDAIVRMGLNEQALVPRIVLFVIGAMLLFGYGLSLNLAPLEFSKVVGLYIATLFVVWQIISFIAFRSVPTVPILMGGALIVAGGGIVTFWRGV